MSKNIVLGISGGIAVYKVASLVSKLIKNDYNVDIIMTKNATEFVMPLTFETLSKNKVIVDMFEEKTEHDVRHISLAEKADLFLVIPATYNIIGKVASGIADDMLTTVISATKAKKIFALAMNTNMYNNPILIENLKKLEKLGYEFIDAAEGKLACETSGKGRMEEPEKIFEYIEDFFQKKQILKGRKILITAGPTEEAIDPIRYLSNRSSGKMGYALAKAARNMGADVSLVSGPVYLKDPEDIKVLKVKTALQMYDIILENYNKNEIVIMAAAVADYRIKNYSINKIKKADDNFILEFERNPDILKKLGEIKEKQFLVGFAAESENLEENAIDKLQRKNLDMIIGNEVNAFNSDENTVIIIDKNKRIEKVDKMDKENLAYKILEEIADRI